MTKRADREKRTDEPVRIKKYANRRLYNTETSSYVTLDDLADMVRAERDFIVVDAKTGDDLTHSVLTQIILEQESKGETLLPVNFLRQLIRFYGDGLQALVPSFLDMSMSSLTREQERYREQMANTFAGTPMELPIEAMQKQAKQNIAMFEQALKMFTPFSPPGASGPVPRNDGQNSSQAADQAPGNATNDQGTSPRAAGSDATHSEIDALRKQLELMQRQIEALSQGKK